MQIVKLLPLALLVATGVNAATENPWYAGARVGGTHFSQFDDVLDASPSYDKDDWGGGVFMGYNLTPNFALEAGYTYLGQGDNRDSTFDGFETQGIDFVGKFSIPITDTFDAFLKGGMYYFNYDNDATDEDYGLSATAGLGVEYFFTDSLSTRLEYQYYFQVGDDDDGVGETDIQFYGVSLVYSWGAAPAPVVVAEPEPEPVPEPVITTVESISVALPFEFDSDELTAEDIALLAPIGERLRQYPDSQLYVIGHTDSRGTEAYNQNLSEERASAVADYLATHFGINSSRVVVQGKGEMEPVAPNDTDAGRAENRRVEVMAPGFQIQQ